MLKRQWLSGKWAGGEALRLYIKHWMPELA